MLQVAVQIAEHALVWPLLLLPLLLCRWWFLLRCSCQPCWLANSS
jgi:hypothetical protein